MQRKIAAIMAADVAGYSRLVAADEDGTLRRLLSCRAISDDVIGEVGGRVFNTAGDAILAEVLFQRSRTNRRLLRRRAGRRSR